MGSLGCLLLWLNIARRRTKYRAALSAEDLGIPQHDLAVAQQAAAERQKGAGLAHNPAVKYRRPQLAVHSISANSLPILSAFMRPSAMSRNWKCLCPMEKSILKNKLCKVC